MVLSHLILNDMMKVGSEDCEGPGWGGNTVPWIPGKGRTSPADDARRMLPGPRMQGCAPTGVPGRRGTPLNPTLLSCPLLQVKGHIAQLAVCLVDPEPRIRALAELFFHELSKKEVKGTSPIYNLLPDILSNLSADSRLGKADFQSIMQAVRIPAGEACKRVCVCVGGRVVRREQEG